jgi:hypothetical protein
MSNAWGLGDDVAAGVGFWPSPDRVPAAYGDFVRRVHVAVVATMAAEEAQAGRDCGGVRALSHYDGVFCSAEVTLNQASRAWRGEQSEEGEALGARPA